MVSCSQIWKTYKGLIVLGNVHTAVVCTEDQRPAAEKLVETVQERSLQLEGTITGEHGVGLHLRDLLVKEVGETGVDLMRKVSLQSSSRHSSTYNDTADQVCSRSSQYS